MTSLGPVLIVRTLLKFPSLKPAIGAPSLIVLFGAMFLLALAANVSVLLAAPLSISPPESWTIRHHQLTVTVTPATHRLAAEDLVHFERVGNESAALRVMLNSHLTVTAIRFGTQALPFSVQPVLSVHDSAHKSDAMTTVTKSGSDPHQIVVHLPDPLRLQKSLTLIFAYHGTIYDPPRPPSGLRYVRSAHTTGHIGPEGVYLSGDTVWYPDITGSLATYSIEVTVPFGWNVVTQGTRLREEAREAVRSQWITRLPSEALTLSGNRFVRQARQWHDMEISTYLLPENRHLANLYLDAAIQYLTFYIDLLGPYPFTKFAVVENFFPSGIGVPSFTLLGSGVIRRGYIQPYALGHEIVHSWIGNAVFNDLSRGNWVEGLTTYLANYYYDERHAASDQARKHRRRMMIEYSLYAPPSEDYPLTQFRHKEHPRDNAIGYHKAAMVFHMLRRELGEAPFFASLRRLVKERIGTYASWETLQHIFEQTAQRPLGWFFEQWITRPGAPQLRIERVYLDHTSQEGTFLRFVVAQTSPTYRLQIPFRVTLESGDTLHLSTELFSTSAYQVGLPLPASPIRLVLDPDFDVLHRIEREHMPPMLNLWVTDSHKAIVLPKHWPRAEQEALEPLLQRLRQHSPDLPQRTRLELTRNESLLVLGNPRYHDRERLFLSGCRNRLTITPEEIQIDGRHFASSETAILVSCPHPRQPGHVISWFYGVSPAAAAKVARLLFFYGWESYFVFQNGRVVARDWFDPPSSVTEVQWNAPSAHSPILSPTPRE
ncbi:MAG: M1 family peptidase [Nitrospirae bacterium]|nr:MAG: M1 family peptidase [Nitrospirota bacterium]